MKITLSILVMLVLTACEQPAEKIVAPEPFIKSAHYFSSAWPKTFWQEFEKGDVAKELQQIKNDGFNTVVLTVPWRGFETGFQQAATTSVEALYARLEFVLSAIVDQQLKFILRLGFPHDYTPNTGTDGLQQCEGLYTDSQMQNHWFNYLKKVKKRIKPFQSAQAGILISWEDHWCPHFVFPNLPAQERLLKAQKMGYGEWLKSKNDSLVKVLLGQNEVNYAQIAVPEKTDESYVFYLEFIDQLLDQKVLQPTQAVFQDAALEIRVDKDPVLRNGEYIWVGHDLYLDEPNHRGTYWAPFWGAANQGELLTAKQALINFDFFLKSVTDDGRSTNHVIEQFNFTDNTPYFPNNANILPDEIDDFLLGAVTLLENYTAGVGVWTYRDYVDNALHNSSFEMGLEGWQVNGQAVVLSEPNQNQLSLEANTEIKQSFIASERFMLISAYEAVNFCLNASHPTTLKLTTNDTLSIDWDIQAGLNCTTISAAPFKQLTATSFSIQTKDAVLIDDLSLHAFTQKLGLYDSAGNPAAYLQDYQKLNQLLPEVRTHQ
ncbi:MAG: hypothetical protein ACSHWU_02905 [Marinicella sp.]